LTNAIIWTGSMWNRR